MAIALIAATGILLWRLQLRHHSEYATITHDGRALRVLVVRAAKPQEDAPVVVMVHEVYGLSDWARNMAGELADEGFTVVAPDLLSGHGPNGGGYGDFASESDVTRAVSDLDPDGVTADLDATVDYARKLPEFKGKVVVVGFSWGGWRTFAFATHRKDLSAAFVFYGTGPADVTTINAPVYGFYAGNDGDVDSTLPATTDAMKAAGRVYKPVMYDGADHGFMRLGDARNASEDNKRARYLAFRLLVGVLNGIGREEKISPTS
ncbi:dienelactone hydrolase family protein [Occallatibacter riparius]|uniref:Dienelactone hydrolase family protein n=1 Tax=Occallatibacter riparius TaxID=1002689 RepID=A0A9J7BR02_9BACT|nr:dienelactone hydrolase family protein [Occallatibacter riparius]UWZ85300.1 dienelactone hydrolase family protein [Occallatibacter riparius]